MSYHDRITLEPGNRGGKPCIRGMRIAVYGVLDWMAQGMTEQQLAFAADREHRLTVVPGN